MPRSTPSSPGFTSVFSPSEEAGRAIASVALAVAEELDLKRAARTVVDQARRALGADGVFVWEAVDGTDTLRLLAQRGFPRSLVVQLRSLSFHAPTLTSRAALHRQLQLQEDMHEAAPELTITRWLAKHYGFRSMLSIPLMARGNLVGVMTYSTKQPHHFTEDQLETVKAIARIFAIGLANARAYQKERELRAELEALVNSSPEGILLVEARTGCMLLANRAAERIVGHSIDREVPVSDYERVYGLRQANGTPVPPEDLPPTRAFRGQTVLGLQMLVRQPAGQDVPVLVNAAPVRDEQGAVVAAVVLFQDISRLKELERQRQDMVSIIAHDLRAPIAVVVGYAELLLSRAPKYGLPERPLQALRGIRDSARSLDQLVADLLEAARLESGKLVLRRQWIDLHALVHGLVQRLEPALRGHAVHVASAAALPRVWADPSRTERVLTNLLVNAAKYSHPQSEIVVRLQDAEGEVTISVADQGPGIAADDLSHIFERYYRGRPPEAAKPGLGLGLYIAKSLVTAQGGRIWADSALGKGSTFHFTLPTRQPKPPKSAK